MGVGLDDPQGPFRLRYSILAAGRMGGGALALALPPDGPGEEA